MDHSTQYSTRAGHIVHPISYSVLEEILARLGTEYGIRTAQITECAAFSMTMVVRYALGLSTVGGRTAAIVDDTLAGWIAMAALRHLNNSGCETLLITLAQRESAEYQDQAKPFTKLRTKSIQWTEAGQADAVADELRTCHNVLCGLFRSQSPNLSIAIDMLNDVETPAHAVIAPPGLDLDLGLPGECPLFASSTVALGLPISGFEKLTDYLGRLYICDVNIPFDFYGSYAGMDRSPYTEQPVMQIFGAQSDEE